MVASACASTAAVEAMVAVAAATVVAAEVVVVAAVVVAVMVTVVVVKTAIMGIRREDNISGMYFDPIYRLPHASLQGAIKGWH